MAYHLLYLYESLFIYLFIYLFITVEILRLDYLKNGQYNHLQIFSVSFASSGIVNLPYSA